MKRDNYLYWNEEMRVYEHQNVSKILHDMLQYLEGLLPACMLTLNEDLFAQLVFIQVFLRLKDSINSRLNYF